MLNYMLFTKFLCSAYLVASVVSDSAILWTVARQTPLSMGFSRQEDWSGLPCPPPGDLPDPGIEPMAPALQAGSLPLCHLRRFPQTRNCQEMERWRVTGMLVQIPPGMFTGCVTLGQ